jgi:hypothetical protein
MTFVFSRVDHVPTNDLKRSPSPVIYVVPIVLVLALAFLGLIFWAVYKRRHIVIREEWGEAQTRHHDVSFPQAPVNIPAVSLCRPSPHFHPPPPPPSQPPSTLMAIPPPLSQDQCLSEPPETIRPSSSRPPPSPLSLASTLPSPGGDFDHPQHSSGRGYMSVAPSGQVVLSYLRNPDHLGAQQAHALKSLQREQELSRSSMAHPFRNSDRLFRVSPARSSTLPTPPVVVPPPSAHFQEKPNRVSRPLPIPGPTPRPSTSSLEEVRGIFDSIEHDRRASTVHGHAM